MGNRPVDPVPYADAMRAADPRLRQPPAGPLARSQPSSLDALREAKFAAYRHRAALRPPAAEPGPRAAAAAEISRQGAAAAREALRRHAR